jgi:hypothetical protein
MASDPALNPKSLQQIPPISLNSTTNKQPHSPNHVILTHDADLQQY